MLCCPLALCQVFTSSSGLVAAYHLTQYQIMGHLERFNQQKLVHKAVSHVQEHMQLRDTMGNPTPHLATMARPNGSRDFINLVMVRPQLGVTELIP